MKLPQKKIFCFCFLFLFALISYPIHADNNLNSIRVGESMTYKIFWMNFYAGDSVMKVLDTTLPSGEKCYKLFTQTLSSSYVSFFYPVRDSIFSVVSKINFLPYKYEKILNEGNFREKQSITFDRINNIAIGKNNKVNIPKDSQDPFSAIYFFRNLKLEVGENLSFDVFDGNKVFKLLIKVIKKERITVPFGIFNTIKIEPIIDGAEGLFKHKGKLYVWVTDDDKKIPVLIKSEVLIGAVSVEMVNYK